MRRFPIIALSVSCVPSAACAQKAQPWPTLFVSTSLNRGWQLSGEIINRVAPDNDRPSQLELRFEAGRVLSSRLTLWAGYVRVRTYRFAQRDVVENQAVEQANWQVGTIGPLKVLSRTRLEQRFVSGVDGASWRVREQLRLAMPLGAKGPSAVLWAEPYVALNRTGAQPKRLEQLRAFAGFALPVTRHADFEIGYLRQHLFRPAGDIDNHAIPVILNLRF